MGDYSPQITQQHGVNGSMTIVAVKTSATGPAQRGDGSSSTAQSISVMYDDWEDASSAADDFLQKPNHWISVSFRHNDDFGNPLQGCLAFLHSAPTSTAQSLRSRLFHLLGMCGTLRCHQIHQTGL